MQLKKKMCSGCDTPQFLWKSNPPLCKNCAGKRSSLEMKGSSTLYTKQKPIKSKPRPSVNGKPLYVALYYAAFGYGDLDFIASEYSGASAVDVHHIDCRGSGGSKIDDRIENLMALTREEHIEYGDKKQHMVMLYTKHMEFLESNGVKFDQSWLLTQIEKYSDNI